MIIRTIKTSSNNNSNSSKNYVDTTTMTNGSCNDSDNDSDITAITTATATTTTEDPSVLWERLQESQRQRMELMEEERIKLQNKIDSMIAVLATPVSDNDIIEIDAGGKIIRALRSTLCRVAPADTMFSCMFSGRSEEDTLLIRDDHGRVFLDHDPELIEIIVNFLRTRKIEKQLSNKPVRSPKVPEGKKDEFESLLHYFGLTDFFYPPLPVSLTLDIANMDVVQPNGFAVHAAKSKNKIQLTKASGRNYMTNHMYFLASKPSLDNSKPSLDNSRHGSFWKVTIDVLPDRHWVYLGIGAIDKSFEDSSSYGWSCGSGVWLGGSKLNGTSGWTEFTEGESLYFHLKLNKLIMFSVQKNRRFVIDIAKSRMDREYYIDFNLYDPGNKISLEPLSKDEREYLLLEN
jgi:hypothetical protein